MFQKFLNVPKNIFFIKVSNNFCTFFFLIFLKRFKIIQIPENSCNSANFWKSLLNLKLSEALGKHSSIFQVELCAI